MCAHYKNRFDKCKGDVKKSWKVLNEMRNKKRNLKFPNYIEINGDIITNRRAIVEKFNDYFVNIAHELNKTKKLDDFSDYHVFLKNRVDSTIFLNDIERFEIEDIIQKLNPSKSSDISPRVLKLFQRQISPYLQILFNKCLHTGVFPDSLKIAKVIPLHKDGDINKNF